MKLATLRDGRRDGHFARRADARAGMTVTRFLMLGDVAIGQTVEPYEVPR